MREKARRARENDELLNQAERRIKLTNTVQDIEKENEVPGYQAARMGDSRVQSTKTRRMSNAAINEGDQVWLFMERVKPVLTKKLARWFYGPFRVKKHVE